MNTALFGTSLIITSGENGGIVRATGVRTVQTSELQAIKASITDLYDMIARDRLTTDITLREPAASVVACADEAVARAHEGLADAEAAASGETAAPTSYSSGSQDSGQVSAAERVAEAGGVVHPVGHCLAVGNGLMGHGFERVRQRGVGDALAAQHARHFGHAGIALHGRHGAGGAASDPRGDPRGLGTRGPRRRARRLRDGRSDGFSPHLPLRANSFSRSQSNE